METAESERLLAQAIRLRPEFAASHALLGKILLDADRAAEAVPSLEKAIQLRPDYSPAHYHLATAYRKLGRAQDAERSFRVFSELKEKERQPARALRYRRGKK
jgi:Flp pilus assembly protein TadD